MFDNESSRTLDMMIDPTAPINPTNKGVLISFVTGKSMTIPEQDVVRDHNI